MRNRYDEMRPVRAIDDLAAAPPRRMFALSPNDALVQVSLPLVLILAIIVRLMVIGQSMATASRGPVILEMWKQQLILRIDRVLDDWEQAAGLPAFDDASRVHWRDGLPEDQAFQHLLQSALALDDLERFGLDLYHRALRYQPDSGGVEPAADAAYFLDLYDPEAPFAPEGAEAIPPEFTITPDRRDYALRHIQDRLHKNREKIEGLQWALVAECAARLPLVDQSDEAQAAAQLRLIAEQLSERGYPLLRSVRQEYGSL